MHDSYRDAAPALRAGTRLEPDGRVFAVAGLRVPQLVASVDRHPASGIRHLASGIWHLASGIRPGDQRFPQHGPVLPLGGFQLVRTAERLAVRRNTLLYRLTKIEELSGRGVREPRTAMAMYLACPADAL
ncbi:PucR family transcriptional regulator [Streptomyces sp. uw30]|uniref:helix-turn-helix domain-containing protein n=1 Tax=Streptomyces sp. uw30 TaxID=1828179 RepID=UPI0011CD887D|nr:helix-turn-helix domain-containing protein [Streptomyces sp. uw30]TXS48609.1 PucR family transcriptional regulator [Streptomyces sp. uw30]